MKLHADVTITAQLTINDREAWLLGQMCSHSYAKWIMETYHADFTLEQVEHFLHDLRCSVEVIMKKKEAAMRAVV